MADSSCAHDVLLNQLADEFAARYRRGERPSLADYVEKYAELADDIRDLFPALVGMERVKEDCQEMEPPVGVLPPLQQLGDYRILREIGHGGMGVVYEAEQISLGRHVALKILPPNLRRDSKQRQRFEREVRAAARLHHTNIVPVFGVGEHDGLPYYAMQFIQGLGLDEVIDELKRMQPGGQRSDGPPVPAGNELRAARKDVSAADVAHSLISGRFEPHPVLPSAPAQQGADDGRAAVAEDPAAVPLSPQPKEERTSSLSPHVTAGRLSDAFELSGSSGSVSGPREDSSGGNRKLTYWQSVARIGVQVASALEYAHQQGILHRDIKPSNLLLDTRGTVWVTDFGLAKVDDQENLTDTGDVLGTVRYMPPEAFDGRSDNRGDVYSLGLTLYEVLVLRPAFTERERSKLIKAVTTGAPPRLERLNRAIPRDLVTIVHKAAEHDPDHRYSTAGELAADLQRFLDDAPIKVRRTSAVEQLARWGRRHKGVAAALGVIVILLMTFAVGAAVTAQRLGHLAEQRKAALDQVSLARDEEALARNKERWQRYRANVGLAASALELNNLDTLRRVLDETPEEYRGFWEWRHFHGQVDNARAVLRPIDPRGKLTNLTVSPNGKQIAAWDSSVKLIRLWDAADRPGAETAALYGQEDNVVLLAYSPDSKQLASAGDRGSLRLWDVETGKPRAVLCLPSVPVNWKELAYAPDGRRIVSCNTDGLRLWDPATGKETAFLSKEAMQVQVALSPNGRRLAARNGNDICLWDVATGRQEAVLGPNVGLWSIMVFSPDGRRIAYSAADTLLLWDGVTGQQVARLRGHKAWASYLVFSPDGSRLASGGYYPDNTVRLWRASDGRPIAVGSGHKNEITNLAFSPDGERLVSSSTDHTARLWDGVTGQEIETLRGHSEKLLGVRFSPDGTRILTWCDKDLRLWEARTGELTAALRGHGAGGARADFAEGGSFVVAEGDGTLRIWDTGLTEQSGILHGHESFVYDVAFSPDGKRLASAGWDHTVRLWDLATGHQVGLLNHEEDDRVVSVAVHPNGRQVAAITYTQGHVHLWNIADSSCRHILETGKGNWGVPARPVYHPRGTFVAAVRGKDRIGLWDPATGALVDELRGPPCKPSDLSFRPDGAQLAVGGEDGVVRIWDLARRTPVAELPGHTDGVYRLAYSPDGHLLASGGKDRTVRLWDAQTYQGLAVLPCGGFVYSVAFSPDSTRLAVGCSDNTIRLFDLATRQQVVELRGHTDYVHGVAFSPDGTRLASASGDRTIRLWDTVPATERARMVPR